MSRGWMCACIVLGLERPRGEGRGGFDVVILVVGGPGERAEHCCLCIARFDYGDITTIFLILE